MVFLFAFYERNGIFNWGKFMIWMFASVSVWYAFVCVDSDFINWFIKYVLS